MFSRVLVSEGCMTGPNVQLICDSVWNNVRLSTFTLKVWRFIWPEVLTHRNLSRNAQSNRAIPTKKLIELVLQDPAIPLSWGRNSPGMGSIAELSDDAAKEARLVWIRAAADARQFGVWLNDLGLHKQVVNRVLEPYQWITAIITAEEWAWKDFIRLRAHPAAQPEIQWIARQIDDQLKSLYPTDRPVHIPFLSQDDFGIGTLDSFKLSTARAARVSYLTHDGKRDCSRDFELHDRLKKDEHMSPFEHAAVFWPQSLYQTTNFRDWTQYRSLVELSSSWEESMKVFDQLEQAGWTTSKYLKTLESSSKRNNSSTETLLASP